MSISVRRPWDHRRRDEQARTRQALRRSRRPLPRRAPRARGGAAVRGWHVQESVRLFLVPVIVGGGKRALPDDVRSDLELRDTHRFASGTVYLRYRCTSAWSRHGRPRRPRHL